MMGLLVMAVYVVHGYHVPYIQDTSKYFVCILVLTLHFNNAPCASAVVVVDGTVTDGIVRMVSVQEVPKRADRNPNTTFYLWTIKHDQVHRTCIIGCAEMRHSRV